MTVWQFIGACLFVYAVIHLHKKYGMSIFKTLAIETFIFIIGVLIMIAIGIFFIS